MPTALMLVAAVVAATMTTPCQAQNYNAYRQAAPGLRPQVDHEPRSRRQPQSPAPAPNPVPQPLVPPGPPVAASRTLLDQEGRILLQKFDDFLFSNLEQAYYRLR